MPAPRTTYVDPLLTNVSVGYKNEQYVAEKFFPTVYVDKETGIYFVKDKENLRAPADARRGEFSRANRVQNTLSEATYTLEEKSLETGISDRVMRNYSDPFNPKSNATELVTEKLLIDNEKDLKTTLLAAITETEAAGTWATITTDIVGTVRSKAALIKKATGHAPNTALIGYDTLMSGIMKNTAFLDSVKYTSMVNDEVLMGALAKWLNVKQVLIGDAVENTAKEGQTDSQTFIWDDLFILAFVAPSAAIETPSAGYRLVQKDARFVDTWYEQEIKTTFVRANDFYDNKVVDTGAIEIIANTITA